MTDADTTTATTDWHAWQESWDRQQEWYMPDREMRFQIMLGGGPPLLAIAQGTFADDDRVGFVTADLKAPDWPAKLPHDS